LPGIVGPRVCNGGAEKHLFDALLFSRIDQLGVVQTLDQVAQAAIDFAQAFFVIEIITVLRTVAVAGGP
jgi:hypothetical protein